MSQPGFVFAVVASAFGFLAALGLFSLYLEKRQRRRFVNAALERRRASRERRKPLKPVGDDTLGVPAEFEWVQRSNGHA